MRDPQLPQLLDEIDAVQTGLTVQRFDTPAEVGEFARDVARWQTTTIRARSGVKISRQAPPLRPDLVARPAEVDAVVARLLGPHDPEAARRVVAIHEPGAPQFACRPVEP